ncbi:MAG: nucleoside hydrolase [Eubacteriales bacterium]|nr:nucleoside hydrolase [Eubacteriales bacterium]
MKTLKEIFPKPDNTELIRRINLPRNGVDVILDSDTYNEIDDQFALSYLVRSQNQLTIRGITAAPFYRDPSTGIFRSESPGDGMEKSYHEILKVLDLLGTPELKDRVYRGSNAYLPDDVTPVDSPAARAMIEISREYSQEHPLYILAIAAGTNVASALLLEPEMAKRVVIVWLGGHAQHYGGCDEFNMKQDLSAARVIYGSGAAVVQVPCMGVVSEFRFGKAELEYRFRDKNELCNYLIDSTYEYAKLKFNYEDWSKPLWDVITVAWALGGDTMLMRTVPSPIPQDDKTYGIDPNRHPVGYVYYVKKDPIAADLTKKLTI